jgi:protein SCO1/2
MRSAPGRYESRRQVRRTASACLVITCVAALAVGTALAQAPTGHEAHMAAAARGAAPSRTGVMTPQPVVVDVPLVDQAGRATSLREAVDTDMPVMVNFIFTSCTTVCPIMSAGFAQLREGLGPERDQVRLLSISIDPETDTVARLRAYAERYGAGASWQLLTGATAATEAAQRAFGAYRGDRNNHAPATYLRRTRKAPWEALEGLSSARMLLRAYREDGAGRGF